MVFRKGQIPWNKGKECPYAVETARSMGKAQKGRVGNNGNSGFVKGHGKLGNGSTGKHWKLTEETKQRQSLAQSKEKNPAWKGGITSENTSIRMSKRYSEWRTAVFVRDNHTCVACGQIGGSLNADHILPFAKYVDRRFDVVNGRTLCVPCHRKTPTYGNKKPANLFQSSIS